MRGNGFSSEKINEIIASLKNKNHYVTNLSCGDNTSKPQFEQIEDICDRNFEENPPLDEEIPDDN